MLGLHLVLWVSNELRACGIYYRCSTEAIVCEISYIRPIICNVNHFRTLGIVCKTIMCLGGVKVEGLCLEIKAGSVLTC